MHEQQWTELSDLELILLTPYYIVNVYEPSEELQFVAVQQNPEILGILDNPSRSVQKFALNRSTGYIIKYIKDPDEELQLLALQHSSGPIVYIQNPTKRVTDQVLRDEDFIITSPHQYKDFVSRIFKDNSILINKWIRYCDNVRDLSTNEIK
jgi:hypothetical protein